MADECAFWRSDESANPDQEVLRAVRPGLATIPGSMLLIASSPYRKAGVLWDAYKRHFGHDDSPMLVWKGTSLEMNPSLDPAVVERAREEDPDSARAEYDAEFRDDISGFVNREVVAACIVQGRFELAPAPTMQYRAFVDPSGGSADSMTLAIGHRASDRAVLDAIREVRAMPGKTFSPESAVADFSALLATTRSALSMVTGMLGNGQKSASMPTALPTSSRTKPRTNTTRTSCPC